MGDRGNVIVIDYDSKVYLYTHWRGSELPSILKRAIVKAQEGGRLDDGPYFARIIFQEMIDGNTGTSGFGISSTYVDGWMDIEVDVNEQTVDGVPILEYAGLSTP